MQDTLTQAWGWVKLASSLAYHHPAFWPIVGAILAYALKPKSEEQYKRIAAQWPQWFWSRWVEFARLLAAANIDADKIIKILKKLKGSGGKSDPPPPPSGPSVITPMLVLALAFMGLTQVSCGPQAERFWRDTFADKTKCAMTYMDYPREEIVKRCFLNADDFERVFDLLAQARAASAKAAADATARAEHKAEIAAAAREQELASQRQRAGCGGYRDGGL